MVTKSSKTPTSGTTTHPRLSAEAVEAESQLEEAKARVRAVKAELKRVRKLAKAAKKIAKRAQKKVVAAEAAAAGAAVDSGAVIVAPARGARHEPVARPRRKPGKEQRSAGDVAKSVIGKMSAAKRAAGSAPASTTAEQARAEHTAPP